MLPNTQRRILSILLKLLQKTENEGKLPKTFYEATITLITKPKIPPPKKKRENNKPLFLMNIDTEFFNKVFTNQIQ